MLLIGAKTCIKANGFVSKYFPISRSCTQGCLIAPLIYILQKEPMACALMLNNDIQVVKLPGEGDVDSLVTKLCMLADVTQIINKDEDSLRESFDVLSTLGQFFFIKSKVYTFALLEIEGQHLQKLNG